MKKAVITVLGHDKVGIIARVCTFLSEANVNILDISHRLAHAQRPPRQPLAPSH